ncbi:MAG: hypothetical protein J2P51_16470, partial [Hyphomicrobiaceae bacterium]|nr:hypothetical protein [Hyphomicrobiaceae bacterium]
DIVGGLDSDRQTRLALGVARGPWGKAPFVESAGIGPFASLLNAVIPRQHAAIAYLRRAFLAASPRAMDVRADGEDLSGEYLAAHVLNIGAIGPRLELARDADPTDEWLDLLLITERDRSAVAAYFAARAAGKQALCPIATHRARRIHIRSWPARDDGYVDDAPWPDERRPQTGAVRIKVEARIAVLLP